jgi:hypothetical protein
VSYANAEIRSTTGTVYACVEYPSRVLELYVAALAAGDRSLIELETPRIPTGQKFYLAPDQIESILPAT